MAEGRRFELLRACALAVFKTAALDRSATPPRRARIGPRPAKLNKPRTAWGPSLTTDH